MKFYQIIFIALSITLTMFFTPTSFADSKKIQVTNALIRVPVVDSVKVTAAFMDIKNNSEIDFKIVGVKGDFAQSFELHNMEMTDGKMKMRTVDSILLKAKSTTKLDSSGLHLMIFDLKEKIKANNNYTLSLVLDNKEEVKINLKAQSAPASHSH